MQIESGYFLRTRVAAPETIMTSTAILLEAFNQSQTLNFPKYNLANLIRC